MTEGWKPAKIGEDENAKNNHCDDGRPELCIGEEQKQAGLPTSLLTHLGGGHRVWRAGHANSRGGVDNGDGIPDPSRRRLVQLEGRRLALVRRNVGSRVGVEGDGVGRDLAGLRGAVRRAAGQRGAVRRGRVDGDDVILGEEVGAEFQVVVEVERAPGLEALTEVGDGYGLLVLPPTPELLVLVLRQARRPAAPTGVVRRRGRLRVCRSWVRVSIVVVV
jgi:hypothetical protein